MGKVDGLRCMLAAAMLVAPAAVPAQSATAARPAHAALDAATKLADWQLRRIDSTTVSGAKAARQWEQAAFWIGMTELADAGAPPRIREAIFAMGRANRWMPGEKPYFADDHAITQAYLWAARNGAGREVVEPTRSTFDLVVGKPAVTTLAFYVPPEGYQAAECLNRWCWCDAIFMAPPAFLDLANQTGDRRYRDFALKEFWATTDFLYDPAEKLYYRDSRFFERRDAQGRKMFWSRGNGWVFAGLARMIRLLPKTSPERRRIEALFREMAGKLKTLQKADGYWAPSLLAPENSPPETSGTGFFTFGLAWGIHAGLLPRAEYEPVVRRGWKALVRAIQPDGRLGWVQQVSDRPDKVEAHETQYYGVGAFLLAASAIAKLDRPNPSVRSSSDQRPRAALTYADYRYGDLMWENDRTAHRIYGRALEAVEPPSGSGIDSWGKSTSGPFMNQQLRSGDPHTQRGKGMDFYNVGASRGAGGIGIWHDNKLWTSRNYQTYRVLRSGPDIVDFEAKYAPWPVGIERQVWETRRFTLPLGTHFTRMVSTIESNLPGPVIVGIGIGRRTTGDGGELTVDRARGLLSWWGPDEPDRGRMAVAIRVDPKMIADVRNDADNHLVLLRVIPGKPFVYYSGSAWSLGQGAFTDRAAWDRYAGTQALDFRLPTGA